MEVTNLKHDEECYPCQVVREGMEAWPVTADIGHCDRCEKAVSSSSDLHTVKGGDYCKKCADIIAVEIANG